MSGAPRLRGLDATPLDRLGRRDLTLAAVTVVGLSRLVEPPTV